MGSVVWEGFALVFVEVLFRLHRFLIFFRRVNKEVRVSIIDVMKRKKLYSTRKLSSREVVAAKFDLVADDPTPDVLAAFEAFVQQKLAAAPIPRRLKSSAVAKRVDKLSSKKTNPLQNLAEIQLYRHMGLIDLQQQSVAFGNILDESQALTLIGGNAAERMELLQPFVPRSFDSVDPDS